MENWRCVSSCSQGFYAVQPNSDSTDTQSTCKRCVLQPLILSAFIIISYILILKCVCMCRCDAGCLACVGPGKENCSECVDGHTLLDGVCVLSHNCVDGKFCFFSNRNMQPFDIK